MGLGKGRGIGDWRRRNLSPLRREGWWNGQSENVLGSSIQKQNQRHSSRAGPNRPGCFIAGTLHDIAENCRREYLRRTEGGDHAF